MTPVETEVDRRIEAMARKVVERRLESAAIFFLELNKPLTFLFSQSVLVAAPFLAPFLGFGTVEETAALFSSRANVDRLMDRIAELGAERDRAREDAA